MKELLEEIQHSSYSMDSGSRVQYIELDELKEILTRYEVVSKENTQPYTTSNE